MSDETAEVRGPRRAADIFDAALTLLGERGYDGVTIEGVAAEAKVNKTTIYRWWPSKDALLGAALRDARLLELDVPDTGSLRGDLQGLLGQILRIVNAKDTGPIVTAILGASTHREQLGTLTKQFFANRLTKEQPIFARAIERGELRPDADVKLMTDLLAGAVWVRVFLRGERAGRAFLRDTVDMVLHGAT